MPEKMSLQVAASMLPFRFEPGDIARITVRSRLLKQYPTLRQVLKTQQVDLEESAETGPFKGARDDFLVHVDGAWRESKSRTYLSRANPAHAGQILGKVPECSREEVEGAVRAAARDFDAWRLLSGDYRMKAMVRFGVLLREHRDEIVQAVTREMGKTLFDARLDVDEAIGVVEVLASQGVNLKGHTYPRIVNGLAMECRLSPRGVAAIITPFNFPVAIPVAQLVAALVTGNTAVWKPSHLTPASSQAVMALLRAALDQAAAGSPVRVPPGVVHLVMGDARTGDALVRAPEVRQVSFTGSNAVGNKVDAIASGLGRKVMKEVSGINAFYVHASADLPRAVRNLLYGKTITGGQRCTSIQDVLVDRAIAARFKAAVVSAAKGVVAGDGASPELEAAARDPDRFPLPPMVSREQQKRVAALVDKAMSQGARVLWRQRIPEALAREGFYYPLTILTNVSEANVLWSNEAFGPVAVWTEVQGIEEAIGIINRKTGIVASIDARDKNATETFLERVLRTRIDDGRHGTGAFWGTKFGGDRGAGSGNPALDEDMAYAYVIWKTIYRAYKPM